jgi:hypothetical protein
MLIVGQVQNFEEAKEIEKIVSIFVLSLRIKEISHLNKDWKYSVNDGCLGFAVVWMSLRNTFDIVLSKDELIQLKNGKVKSIQKPLQLDNEKITITIYGGD